MQISGLFACVCCDVAVASPVHTWTARSQNISRVCKGHGTVSSAYDAICQRSKMALWHHDQVHYYLTICLVILFLELCVPNWHLLCITRYNSRLPTCPHIRCVWVLLETFDQVPFLMHTGLKKTDNASRMDQSQLPWTLIDRMLIDSTDCCRPTTGVTRTCQLCH